MTRGVRVIRAIVIRSHAVPPSRDRAGVRDHASSKSNCTGRIGGKLGGVGRRRGWRALRPRDRRPHEDGQRGRQRTAGNPCVCHDGVGDFRDLPRRSSSPARARIDDGDPWATRPRCQWPAATGRENGQRCGGDWLKKIVSLAAALVCALEHSGESAHVPPCAPWTTRYRTPSSP
jgi:hypothetical protein